MPGEFILVSLQVAALLWQQNQLGSSGLLGSEFDFLFLAPNVEPLGKGLDPFVNVLCLAPSVLEQFVQRYGCPAWEWILWLVTLSRSFRLNNFCRKEFTNTDELLSISKSSYMIVTFVFLDFIGIRRLCCGLGRNNWWGNFLLPSCWYWSLFTQQNVSIKYLRQLSNLLLGFLFRTFLTGWRRRNNVCCLGSWRFSLGNWRQFIRHDKGSFLFVYWIICLHHGNFFSLVHLYPCFRHFN